MDPCTLHCVGDGISPAPASRAEARGLVWGGEVGFYIPMPNPKQGFWPKQICAQRTLATCHRISGCRAFPVSPLCIWHISLQICWGRKKLGLPFPGSWVVFCWDKLAHLWCPQFPPDEIYLRKVKKWFHHFQNFHFILLILLLSQKCRVAVSFSLFFFFLANKWGVCVETSQPTVFMSLYTRLG